MISIDPRRVLVKLPTGEFTPLVVLSENLADNLPASVSSPAEAQELNKRIGSQPMFKLNNLAVQVLMQSRASPLFVLPDAHGGLCDFDEELFRKQLVVEWELPLKQARTDLSEYMPKLPKSKGFDDSPMLMMPSMTGPIEGRLVESLSAGHNDMDIPGRYLGTPWLVHTNQKWTWVERGMARDIRVNHFVIEALEQHPALFSCRWISPHTFMLWVARAFEPIDHDVLRKDVEDVLVAAGALRASFLQAAQEQSP